MRNQSPNWLPMIPAASWYPCPWLPAPPHLQIVPGLVCVTSKIWQSDGISLQKLKKKILSFVLFSPSSITCSGGRGEPEAVPEQPYGEAPVVRNWSVRLTATWRSLEMNPLTPANSLTATSWETLVQNHPAKLLFNS